MKALLLTAALAASSLAAPITWNGTHEAAIEKSTLAFAHKLPLQTVIIGRTGLTTTRVAVVINEDGHLLSPYLRSIDEEDAPYLLYKPDGSRIKLTTVAEKPKRFLALLKLEEKDESLLPTRISKVVDHTVIIPTCAPIASLGETPGMYVEHLEFTPPEKATALRLDSIFHSPGTPVFDLSGSLIAMTLEPRQSNTPALFITRILEEFSELDAILPNETESNLPSLPLAPVVDADEAKELTDSPLRKARERFVQSTHPLPLPCALIFNEGSQATHSIIGTVVRQDGMILTKASELGPDLLVRIGGQSHPGVLLATDEKTDLALVGIAASGLPVVRWTDELPKPGTTLVSPVLLQEATEDMIAEPTSYTGSFTQILQENTPPVHATSQITSLGLVTEQIENGIVIAAIKAETPAFESGLSPGDLIETIEGKSITLRTELTDLLDSHRVGDELTVKIKRGEESQEFKVKLTSALIIPPATGIEAPKISMIPSVRRGPFPEVLVHTIPLNAWDCGSPIFDLKGRALGLNIAALSPTRTLALRPSEVRAALARLLAETRAF
ncbi:MAG: S1-C subfamily serine protease [Paracoccaceae bacterium]|jgi:S1-C subfamily serine protease